MLGSKGDLAWEMRLGPWWWGQSAPILCTSWFMSSVDISGAPSLCQDCSEEAMVKETGSSSPLESLRFR